MTLDGFTCPCSFAQRRLWFLDRLNPGGCEYNIPAAIRLLDPIDPHVLEQGVNALVRRHESLRTTFTAVDGDPVQVIAPDLFVPVTVGAIGGPLEAARTEALRIAGAEAAAPFDLERGPLLRVTLLSLGDRERVLLITTHHIVSDGWSMDVCFRELTALYEACAAGRPSPLPELPIQYADYAVWQQEPRQRARMEDQLEYWRRQLAGAAPLQFPADFPRPAVSSYRGRRESLWFDAALAARLQALSREEGTTLYMTLLACFALLLARCSGQHDITIGTLTAGRDRLETEGLIGFFVNTLALRIDLAGNPGVRGLLARVKQTALEAYAHADVPFERLVEELRPDRDLSRTPLVQITFQLFKLPGSDEGTAAPRAEMLDVRKGTAKFDLALDMWEEDGGLTARMEYCADLFEPGTIRRLLGHFETLIRAATDDPDQPVESLPLLTSAETHRQIHEWNDTDRPGSRELCAPDLFERQVRRTPAAPAVIDGSVEWTYDELDRRAAAIAGRLRALGIAGDSRVGICMRRSAVLVAAMLGVWKAGGAYVPLDPSYPRERLAFMADDAQVRIVIADENATFDFAAPIVRLSAFDPGARPFEDTSFGSCGVGSCGVDAREPSRAPHDLAYILYTSGSTGRPKGVAIEHRNTAALIHWATSYYPASQLAGVLASTSVSFDLSVFELFAPLCSGGAVIVAENALALAALPAADRVTLVNTVPSAAAELVRAGAVPARARTMNLAGEPLDPSLVAEIFGGTNVERIVNLYGPTEDTTYSTCAAIERGESWRATIGRPLPNRRAYVLDARLQPVPIGVAGELYLGGDGVARGYWNQPALTAERFILSPFVPHDRLYKTGDLARYRQNSDIEFLGRADSQVKLRGFRIELGEIEAALRRDPGVADAVVQLRQDAAAGPQLVAYVVRQVRMEPDSTDDSRQVRLKPDTTEDGDATDILRRLAVTLPHYMIPSAVVALDRLPLTPNGKVDRAALPSPAKAPAFAARPRTGLERAIAALREDLLGVRGVGLTDNFFELGGHSLLLLRLQSRLRDTVGDVPLLDLFRFPTVQTLATHLASGETGRTRDVAAAQRRAQDQHARVRQQALSRSSRQSLAPQAGSRIPDPGSRRGGAA